MPKEKSLIGWQVGLSLPAHLGFTATVHVCGALYTTGRKTLSPLGQAASLIGTEKSHVSLHSSWSSGRCLPCFQTWGCSAQRSCCGLQRPAILHETERGISPSLLNAEATSPPHGADKLWPSLVKLEHIFEKLICSDSKDGSCRGHTQWAQRPSSNDSLTTQLFFASCLVNQSSRSICPRSVWLWEHTGLWRKRTQDDKTQLRVAERIRCYFSLTLACCRQGISCLNSDLTKSLWELFIKRDFFSGNLFCSDRKMLLHAQTHSFVKAHLL